MVRSTIIYLFCFVVMKNRNLLVKMEPTELVLKPSDLSEVVRELSLAIYMAGCTTTSDCFLASADFLGLNVYIASALPEFYCTV